MVLVIGAGGFIGAYLVDALREQGKDVYAIDNNWDIAINASKERFPKILGDYAELVDIRYLEETDIPWSKITSVVNLASLQPANDDGTATLADYVMVNTVGLCNVLEQCRIHGIKRMVHCMSTKLETPIGEYAALTISEHAAKKCTEYYHWQHGVNVWVLGLVPVYGYGPHLEIFKQGKPHKTGFATFIGKARVGEPIEVWGDCQVRRHIVYVKDVVDAIITVLNGKRDGGYYDVVGLDLSLLEEAETITKVFARDKVSPIIFRPDIPNGITDSPVNIGTFSDLCDWHPQYWDFATMCRDYIEEEKSGRYKWLVEKRQRMMAPIESGFIPIKWGMKDIP